MSMAKAGRAFNQGAAQLRPADQQRLIAEQTAVFLAAGGQIRKIPKGVSGQAKLGGPQLESSDAAVVAPA
jgi:hypothetical protein